MNLKTIFVGALMLWGSSYQADTLIHNIKGYTSTEEGLLEFSGLHIDDAGKVKSTS